jgi:hypothetical protein
MERAVFCSRKFVPLTLQSPQFTRKEKKACLCFFCHARPGYGGQTRPAALQALPELSFITSAPLPMFHIGRIRQGVSSGFPSGFLTCFANLPERVWPSRWQIPFFPTGLHPAVRR